MKRSMAFFLALCLAFILAVPAAAGDPVWQSKLAPLASASEYRRYFVEAESADIDGILTRGTAAGLITRLVLGGEDPPISSIRCQDIDYESWYAPGAVWALDNGFFSMDGENFCPDLPVAREEFCLMLTKALGMMGRRLPYINEWYSFLDAGLFTTQEKRDAAAELQKWGIMTEDKDGMFYPTEDLSLSDAKLAFLRLFASQSDPLQTLPVVTVEEREPVDNSWFDDACFIGHSQVVGMKQYFDLPNADYYAVIGHTAKDVLEFPYYSMPQGRMGTLDKGLHQKSYSKVYIMLGINDCTLREDRIAEFLAPMREIMDIVTETQPNAKIYLLSLAPVGRNNRSPAYYSLENTILYSQAVKELSREYGTEYLDVFRLLCDESGYIQDKYNAGDGIHIAAKYYDVIKDYLKTHT